MVLRLPPWSSRTSLLAWGRSGACRGQKSLQTAPGAWPEVPGASGLPPTPASQPPSPLHPSSPRVSSCPHTQGWWLQQPQASACHRFFRPLPSPLPAGPSLAKPRPKPCADSGRRSKLGRYEAPPSNRNHQLRVESTRLSGPLRVTCCDGLPRPLPPPTLDVLVLCQPVWGPQDGLPLTSRTRDWWNQYFCFFPLAFPPAFWVFIFFSVLICFAGLLLGVLLATLLRNQPQQRGHPEWPPA